MGIFKKLTGWFWVQEGEKQVLNLKKVCAIAFLFLGLFLIIFVVLCLSEKKQSVSQKVDRPLIRQENLSQSVSLVSYPNWVKAPETSSEKIQAIEDNENAVSKKTQSLKIAKGGQIIVKLTTSIDTRSLGEARVIGIYDLKNFKRGTEFIGKISYPEKGERVFIQFFRAILPDGEIKKITAHAKDAKDYQDGLIGTFHSDRPLKHASHIGFSVLSGAAEGLAQGLLGESGSRLKGAALQGVSRAADSEVQNKFNEIESNRPYVTLDAGKEVIITLDKDFR